ncbi:response regulator transcription factor [Lentiprolixibacter aurantiacus]|uniref:Response regulator transcription factor n=1 Tax=Lentiprolixibacter aurantiacus TaxID=2993939 RepID=A0AAE3MLQ6_9FLAO|nr:response regulator transcription factor [Lentiprolixibacter aurantiacus]MCX2719748.1 response regulator transcription factor [Lentiprolixibacter aurantiacus]
MNTSTLQVMVIDNDPKFHETYRYYFHNYNEFNLIGIYNSAEEALEDYLMMNPDIVLSEVNLPEMTGIEAISAFRKLDSEASVLMVSNENDFETIKLAFKFGAAGYLTKPISVKRLLHALNSIKDEGAALSNDIVKKLIDTFRRKSYKFFSERENQIIEHLCQGDTYKTIANKLYVSTSTINFHIQNIYLKLDVNSKSEALNKIRQLDFA